MNQDTLDYVLHKNQVFKFRPYIVTNVVNWPENTCLTLQTNLDSILHPSSNFRHPIDLFFCYLLRVLN